MGQYKLQIKFKLGFGIYIEYEKGFNITINLPFVMIYIGLTGGAHGYDIFGKTSG